MVGHGVQRRNKVGSVAVELEAYWLETGGRLALASDARDLRRCNRSPVARLVAGGRKAVTIDACRAKITLVLQKIGILHILNAISGAMLNAHRLHH